MRNVETRRVARAIPVTRRRGQSRGLTPRQEQEARRLESAELFRAGLSHSEIARRLGVSRKAVIDWHKRFDAEGEEGLRYKSAGYEAYLTEDQYQQIAEALIEGPEAHGFPTQIWTLERVADLIERLTGVRYAVGYVWYVLRDRLGFTCQKPVYRAKERNEEAIEYWKTEVWPEIKKGRRNRTPA